MDKMDSNHDYNKDISDIKKIYKEKKYHLLLSKENDNVIRKLTCFLPASASNRQRYWHIMNDVYDVVLCTNCKSVPARYSDRKYVCCSAKCKKELNTKKSTDAYNSLPISRIKSAKDKKDATCLERYGTINPSSLAKIKAKIKKTNVEKYGVEHVFLLNRHKLTADDVLKMKKTNIERYGVDNIAKSDISKESSKLTNIKKYGVEHYSQTDECKLKIIATSIKKYGVSNYSQTDGCRLSLSNLLKDKCQARLPVDYQIVEFGVLITLHHQKCNKEFTITNKNLYTRKEADNKLCTYCFPGSIRSFDETDVCEYIKSKYSGQIVTNSRKIIPPFELDIYLPELNLAFEYNGLYFHSDYYKDRLYHRNKYRSCENKGIRLINVWEDDWVHRQEIIKSIIDNALGINNKNKIYARKCSVEIISDKNSAVDFLNKNHIQGGQRCTVFYGCYHSGQLISVAGFNIYSTYIELSRFASGLSTKVIGSMSKILAKFKKAYNLPIRTYCDLSVFSGVSYAKVGFKLIRVNEPNYQYVDLNSVSRMNKRSFRSTKDKSESENTKSYPKIYNSGIAVYEIQAR